jgi:hypothetical protein
MGRQLSALVDQLDATCRSVDELTQAAEDAFARHERSAVIASFPGVGALTGARLLAEIGDDDNRFADARALKAYAGAAPITRASGKAHWVGARRAKNDRIAATGYVWALAAVRHDPACRAHYQRRRATGERHTAALRNTFNKLIGKLHHCLGHRPALQQRTGLPSQTGTGCSLTNRLVRCLDQVEHRSVEAGDGRPRLAVDELSFDGGEEALDHGLHQVRTPVRAR